MFRNKRARKVALNETKDMYLNFKKWWAWTIWIVVIVAVIIGYITDTTVQTICGAVEGLIVGGIILFITTYILES